MQLFCVLSTIDIDSSKSLNGTYYAKISVWKQPAYNGKNPPIHFFIIKKIINSLLDWAVSDSPSVYVTEGEKSRPFVTLPCKQTQTWVRSCGPSPPFMITCCSCWRYTMSAPKRLFKCCVLGCTNEHMSLHRLPPSEPRTLWLRFIV